MKNVLLVGSTGHLGGMIARELLKRGAKLRLLVRAAAQLAPEIAAQVEVVEDETKTFDGIHTVVSAVQGGLETIVAAQLGWLAAARKAGVKRFIPSDYSYNLFALAEGENINSDWRREFARKAAEQAGPVEVVHLLNGVLLDRGVLFGFLGMFDLEKSEAYLWGDGNERMEFTTFADTAAYAAELALAEGKVPSQFFVAGDSLNFQQLVDATARGLGRPITVKKLGTLEDLSAEIARRMQTEPQNMMAWLPLMYSRGMLSGKGKLGSLMNSMFPSIRPMGVSEYARTMAVSAGASSGA